MTFSWNEIKRTPTGAVRLLFRHQRVFDEGLVAPGSDVLDIGGWGVLATALIEFGARCTILDRFTVDQYYPGRVRALPHVVGDARDAGLFPAGSFDLVTCFETLEHCGDASAVLRNAFRWLRPGGRLVGTVPIPGFCHFDGEPGVELLSAPQLVDGLSAAGFSAATVTPTRSDYADVEPCSLYFLARRS